MRTKSDYDAIVVGSGPNGLVAAITLQHSGLAVLLVEGEKTIGGGLRSAELTLPGFVHDVCSAVHPLAVCSPVFENLSLNRYGLEFIFPPVAAAHPFDDGSAAALYPSLEQTAQSLGQDQHTYIRLMKPFLRDWSYLLDEILSPVHFPKHPFPMARFGLTALKSATHLAKRFQSKHAKGLWAGMASHSIRPLSSATTSSIALVLMGAAHAKGWPVPKGGAASIASALSSLFLSLGGKIETDFYVRSLEQLPSASALLFDITPRQLLKIAGHRFSSIYKWQLERFRYGMGVFKIDWALDGPIPFKAPLCMQAGTLHLGNTLEEIVASEQLTSEGHIPKNPFVLLAQQSLFDPTRTPEGKQIAWAYCHVPNGSKEDMTARIERQVERFAPGFRDRILARHTMNTSDIERYNPNYVGGDIAGGMMNIGQLFTRPALRFSPYKTSANRIYICSSSSPPGPGVHGMCGYHAAKKVLKDIFHKTPSIIQ